MISTAFNEENVVFDTPEGLTTVECEPISAWMGTIDNTTPAVISCWKVTKEELEEIQKTGRVWLYVMGNRMPPVHLTGIHPFTDKDSV